MLRTVWGDDQRFRDTYWSKWPDTYFPGDGAKQDDDGVNPKQWRRRGNVGHRQAIQK